MDYTGEQSRGQIASTQVRMPRYSMGAAPLGNLYRPVAEHSAAAALRAASELGFSHIDTAPHYGFGLSETRVGRALAEGLDFQVSTKVGRVLEPIAPGERAPVRFGFADPADFKPVFDYSYEGVMSAFEASCRRLGREQVSIAFAHDLGALTHGEDDGHYWRQFCEGGLKALLSLKAAGRIDAIGLGVNEVAVCERALNELPVDVLLLAGRYTLLEQSPLEHLLPQCQRAGVSVIAAGPFNSGILAGGLEQRTAHYNYQPAPEAIVARTRSLQSVCDQFDVPLQAAALQLPAAHPAVVSVLAGFASAEEVASARRWIDTPIPEQMWQMLKERELLHADAPVPSGVL